MDSRNAVLMNLFAGREWKCRYREWTCGHSRGRREWDKWRKQHRHIHCHVLGLDSSWGCKESDTTEQLSLHFTSCVKRTAGEKMLYNTWSSAWHFLMT